MISTVHPVLKVLALLQRDKVGLARTNTAVAPSLIARIVKFIGSATNDGAVRNT
jgi:hypothetical protein